MSLHTEDALEGFTELLNAVGVTLRFGDESFEAVLSTEQSDHEPFDLTPGDDQSVRVSAFASAFTIKPEIGDYFEDDGGTRYRIKSRRQRPRQSIIRFSCEVSEL